ncbi:MAG: ribose 5-phosphate isomerase B [Phycisphaeraceae bacterium]|nr:MAG: ribose 5-phosphate isomerase B [Phycisphaeraceae bacterium]
MRIAISADHRGRGIAEQIGRMLAQLGHEVLNWWPGEGEKCDYPDAAARVGKAVASGEADQGILVCGTGIGMSIAANKIAGVRAALVHDELTAGLARSHNDANVLCLSGDLLGERKVSAIVEKWLKTEFEGGRHQRRVEKIAELERGEPG